MGEGLLLEAHHRLSKIDNTIPLFNSMQDAATVIAGAKQAGMERIEFYGILEYSNGNPTTGRGELIVAKHRNGETGTINFMYNKSMARIK